MRLLKLAALFISATTVSSYDIDKNGDRQHHVDCAKLLPDEPCVHHQCYGFQPWPKRGMRRHATNLPLHDDVALEQLMGNCAPLRDVDEERYRRCIATMTSTKTFFSGKSPTLEGNDTDANVNTGTDVHTAFFRLDTHDTNAPDSSIIEYSVPILASRGTGPPRCCILTQGCYDWLEEHLDEKIHREGNRKVWERATCCMILWELSCPGGWSHYPDTFYRPPRCSNPEYPDR